MDAYAVFLRAMGRGAPGAAVMSRAREMLGDGSQRKHTSHDARAKVKGLRTEAAARPARAGRVIQRIVAEMGAARGATARRLCEMLAVAEAAHEEGAVRGIKAQLAIVDAWIGGARGGATEEVDEWLARYRTMQGGEGRFYRKEILDWIRDRKTDFISKANTAQNPESATYKRIYDSHKIQGKSIEDLEDNLKTFNVYQLGVTLPGVNKRTPGVMAIVNKIREKIATKETKGTNFTDVQIDAMIKSVKGATLMDRVDYVQSLFDWIPVLAVYENTIAQLKAANSAKTTELKEKNKRDEDVLQNNTRDRANARIDECKKKYNEFVEKSAAFKEEVGKVENITDKDIKTELDDAVAEADTLSAEIAKNIKTVDDFFDSTFTADPNTFKTDLNKLIGIVEADTRQSVTAQYSNIDYSLIRLRSAIDKAVGIREEEKLDVDRSNTEQGVERKKEIDKINTATGNIAAQAAAAANEQREASQAAEDAEAERLQAERVRSERERSETLAQEQRNAAMFGEGEEGAANKIRFDTASANIEKEIEDTNKSVADATAKLAEETRNHGSMSRQANGTREELKRLQAHAASLAEHLKQLPVKFRKERQHGTLIADARAHDIDVERKKAAAISSAQTVYDRSIKKLGDFVLEANGMHFDTDEAFTEMLGKNMPAGLKEEAAELNRRRGPLSQDISKYEKTLADVKRDIDDANATLTNVNVRYDRDNSFKDRILALNRKRTELGSSVKRMHHFYDNIPHRVDMINRHLDSGSSVAIAQRDHIIAVNKAASEKERQASSAAAAAAAAAARKKTADELNRAEEPIAGLDPTHFDNMVSKHQEDKNAPPPDPTVQRAKETRERHSVLTQTFADQFRYGLNKYDSNIIQGTGHEDDTAPTGRQRPARRILPYNSATPKPYKQFATHTAAASGRRIDSAQPKSGEVLASFNPSTAFKSAAVDATPQSPGAFKDAAPTSSAVTDKLYTDAERLIRKIDGMTKQLVDRQKHAYTPEENTEIHDTTATLSKLRAAIDAVRVSVDPNRGRVNAFDKEALDGMQQKINSYSSSRFTVKNILGNAESNRRIADAVDALTKWAQPSIQTKTLPTPVIDTEPETGKILDSIEPPSRVGNVLASFVGVLVSGSEDAAAAAPPVNESEDTDELKEAAELAQPTGDVVPTPDEAKEDFNYDNAFADDDKVNVHSVERTKSADVEFGDEYSAEPSIDAGPRSNNQGNIPTSDEVKTEEIYRTSSEDGTKGVNPGVENTSMPIRNNPVPSDSVTQLLPKTANIGNVLASLAGVLIEPAPKPEEAARPPADPAEVPAEVLAADPAEVLAADPAEVLAADPAEVPAEVLAESINPTTAINSTDDGTETRMQESVLPTANPTYQPLHNTSGRVLASLAGVLIEPPSSPEPVVEPAAAAPESVAADVSATDSTPADATTEPETARENLRQRQLASQAAREAALTATPEPAAATPEPVASATVPPDVAANNKTLHDAQTTAAKNATKSAEYATDARNIANQVNTVATKYANDQTHNPEHLVRVNKAAAAATKYADETEAALAAAEAAVAAATAANDAFDVAAAVAAIDSSTAATAAAKDAYDNAVKAEGVVDFYVTGGLIAPAYGSMTPQVSASSINIGLDSDTDDEDESNPSPASTVNQRPLERHPDSDDDDESIDGNTPNGNADPPKPESAVSESINAITVSAENADALAITARELTESINAAVALYAADPSVVAATLADVEKYAATAKDTAGNTAKLAEMINRTKDKAVAAANSGNLTELSKQSKEALQQSGACNNTIYIIEGIKKNIIREIGDKWFNSSTNANTGSSVNPVAAINSTKDPNCDNSVFSYDYINKHSIIGPALRGTGIPTPPVSRNASGISVQVSPPSSPRSVSGKASQVSPGGTPPGSPPSSPRGISGKASPVSPGGTPPVSPRTTNLNKSATSFGQYAKGVHHIFANLSTKLSPPPPPPHVSYAKGIYAIYAGITQNNPNVTTAGRVKRFAQSAYNAMFKANGSNNFGINSGFARAMILLQGAANDAKPYGTGAWNGLSSSIEYMGSAAKWFVNGGTPYFMNFGLALIEGLAIILNVQTDCDTDEYTGRVAITHSFPGSNVNDVETLLVLHKDKSAGAPADKYDIHSYFAEGKLKNIPLSPEDLPTRFSKQWAAIQEWRNAAPHTDDADADEEPNDADADGAADDGDEVDYDDDMAALWNTTDNDRWSDLNDAQGETKRYHIHGNTNTGPVPMDHETAESSVPTGAAIVDTGAETVRT